MVKSSLCVLVGVVALAGCRPAFSDRSSSLHDERVLAIQSSPAQAAPGDDVSYKALVASPKGTLDSLAIDWAYCTQPKPVNELNDVSVECFVRRGDQIVRLGTGPTAKGTIPDDACRQFGPDVPQASAGQPAGRPTDPDATGGYYQPLRLFVPVTTGGTLLALGSTRITCGLPDATQSEFEDYQQRTRPNENPTLAAVELVRGQNAEPLSDANATTLTEVKPGEKVVLRASWPACPDKAVCGDGICSPHEDVQGCPADCTDPHGCGGPEPYGYYDPLSRTLRDRHESMRVSWVATAGSFQYDHTGRTESEYDKLSTQDRWTAPKSPATVDMWVVLRDSRGGVTWGEYRVQVQ